MSFRSSMANSFSEAYGTPSRWKCGGLTRGSVSVTAGSSTVRSASAACAAGASTTIERVSRAQRVIGGSISFDLDGPHVLRLDGNAEPRRRAETHLRGVGHELRVQRWKRVFNERNRIRSALLVDHDVILEIELRESALDRFFGIGEYRRRYHHRNLVELREPGEPVAGPATITHAVADAEADPLTEPGDVQVADLGGRELDVELHLVELEGSSAAPQSQLCARGATGRRIARTSRRRRRWRRRLESRDFRQDEAFRGFHIAAQIERRDENQQQHEPGCERTRDPAPLPHGHHSTAVARFSVFAPASFASSMTRTSTSVVALLSACITTGRSSASSSAATVERTPWMPMLLRSYQTSPVGLIAITMKSFLSRVPVTACGFSMSMADSLTNALAMMKKMSRLKTVSSIGARSMPGGRSLSKRS